MAKDNEGVSVSKFDYSVENHFKAMDKITLIDDGDESLVEFDQTEIHRMSSSVTFLRFVFFLLTVVYSCITMIKCT